METALREEKAEELIKFIKMAKFPFPENKDSDDLIEWLANKTMKNHFNDEGVLSCDYNYCFLVLFITKYHYILL